MKRPTSLAFLVLIIIIIYRYLCWPSDDELLRKYLGKNLEVEAWVVGEPEEKNGGQRFTVRVEKINMEKIDGSREHLVQVSLKSSEQIKYGDRINLSGKMQNIFDGSESYGRYMRVSKIFYQMRFATATVIENQSPSRLMTILINLKNEMIQKINNQLPAPESFLATGLILTGKGSLDTDLQNDFKRTGLIHIVVLSGFNVSIVAVVIMELLKFLPKVVRFVFGVFFMTCFCLMVGAGASVIRSLVMNIISIYGKLIGLNYRPIKGLFIAGLLMLVFNPMLLFFDPSFQMSFMATLGLVLLSDKLSNHLVFLTEKFGVRETISATLSTQIAVTPLIMHLSGVVSLISPITNILVLPLIPYTMLFVTVQMLSSYLTDVLTILTSCVSYFLLAYELKVVRFFSALPFSAIELETWDWYKTLLCYFVMILIYIFIHNRGYKILRKSEVSEFYRRHETQKVIPDPSKRDQVLHTKL